MQVDKDLKKLATIFKAQIKAQDFHALKAMQDYEAGLDPNTVKELMGLKRKPSSPVLKTPEDDGRVYPNYFAPVIVMENGKRVIKPMRYRVRLNGSTEEIPTKYNVFNARIDALEKRKTWQALFTRNHGLFPFIKFYEWVEEGGRKKLINFSPDHHEIMWAPCLFDHWQSKDKKIKFYSFALITDDPPPEIAEKGHDRCPIFLDSQNIDAWLTPEGKSKQEFYALLKQIEQVYYHFQWAA